MEMACGIETSARRAGALCAAAVAGARTFTYRAEYDSCGPVAARSGTPTVREEFRRGRGAPQSRSGSDQGKQGGKRAHRRRKAVFRAMVCRRIRIFELLTGSGVPTIGNLQRSAKKSRFGHTSRFPKRLRQPHGTSSRRLPTTWNGFGRYPSIRESSASDM